LHSTPRVQRRLRLRLFVQEFDLRPGTTRIGRSSSCGITIDDPSISREHAEIVVDDQGARIRDLGSRNGVRVNGVRIEVEWPLHEGDKVRLGQQDLIVTSESAGNLARTARARACRVCEVPFSTASANCPLCGADADAATMQTVEIEIDDRPTPVQRAERTTWWISLHAELLDKAIATGRVSEAEQTLTRVDEAFAQAILARESYDAASIEPLLSCAVRFAVSRGNGRWLTWVLETMRAFGIVASGALVAQLESAPPQLLDQARVALASYVADVCDRSPAIDGLAAIAESVSSSSRVRARRPVSNVPRAS